MERADAPVGDTEYVLTHSLQALSIDALIVVIEVDLISVEQDNIPFCHRIDKPPVRLSDTFGRHNDVIEWTVGTVYCEGRTFAGRYNRYDHHGFVDSGDWRIRWVYSREKRD